MRMSWVTVFGALTGSIWGAVWMIVVGILLMLVSGITTHPPVGIAMGIGAVVGICAFAIVNRFADRISMALLSAFWRFDGQWAGLSSCCAVNLGWADGPIDAYGTGRVHGRNGVSLPV